MSREALAIFILQHPEACVSILTQDVPGQAKTLRLKGYINQHDVLPSTKMASFSENEAILLPVFILYRRVFALLMVLHIHPYVWYMLLLCHDSLTNISDKSFLIFIF